MVQPSEAISVNRETINTSKALKWVSLVFRAVIHGYTICLLGHVHSAEEQDDHILFCSVNRVDRIIMGPSSQSLFEHQS